MLTVGPQERQHADGTGHALRTMSVRFGSRLSEIPSLETQNSGLQKRLVELKGCRTVLVV